MKYLTTMLLSALSVIIIWGQNGAPEIANLSITTDSADHLIITYDLTDAENDQVEITLRVSEDGGKTFLINTDNSTGDIGFPISPGTEKRIVWNHGTAILMDGNYKIRLIADDRNTIDIQDIVDQVDSARLKRSLQQIEGIRHRASGAIHLENTKDLISDHMVDHNLSVTVPSFSYNNYTAENFIGSKRGLTEEKATYYVTGHFDTVDDSPGADDNGSAIAALLEVITILAPYNFKKTIKFAAFDLEESGLVGSFHYVNTHGLPIQENVAGVFNFEMIGYYDDTPDSQRLPMGFNLLFPEAYNKIRDDQFRGNFISNVGIHSHPELSAAFEMAAQKYVPELKVVSILAPNNWQILTPDLARSDHAPFWLKDLPAIMLTDGANFRNQNYHSPGDTAGTLNFNFMSQVVKATVGALAEMAELSNSTFEETDVEILTQVANPSKCPFLIHPNPVLDKIQINLSNCQSGHWSVHLFTVQGQEVHRSSLRSGTKNVDLNTSDLRSGIYLLVLKNGDATHSRKLVIDP